MKKNSKKKKEENVYLKILVALIILIISFILVCKSTNITESIASSYSSDSSIDYKVYIRDNEYIPEEYMGKNKTYIEDLVTKIALDYNYSYSHDQKLDTDFKYSVVATTTVRQNSTGKELWSDTTTLVESKEVSAKGKNKIEISESVEVPFEELDLRVQNFGTEFNIPIDAELSVELILRDITGKTIDTTGVSMDLDEDTFTIKETSTGVNVKNIIERSEINRPIVMIEAAVCAISLLYVVFKIYSTFNIAIARKSYYAKSVHKILKNYGDIVAEVVKPVDLTGLKVIDVKNFDQMLDVEEELRIPIMFFETIKNEEGHFVLVHRDIAYRFVLKDKFKK